MNKLFIALIVLAGTRVVAQESEQYQCKKKSDCEVVKVLTRCDVEKQKLRNKIYALEKQVSDLKKEVVVLESKTSVVKTETKIVNNTVEKEKVRHHTLSLNMGPDVTGTSNSSNGNTITVNANYGYVPGLMYQYQFDSGLVPGVGINSNGHPSAYLGWGF